MRVTGCFLSYLKRRGNACKTSIYILFLPFLVPISRSLILSPFICYSLNISNLSDWFHGICCCDSLPFGISFWIRLPPFHLYLVDPLRLLSQIERHLYTHTQPHHNSPSLSLHLVLIKYRTPTFHPVSLPQFLFFYLDLYAPNTKRGMNTQVRFPTYISSSCFHLSYCLLIL